MNKDVEWPVPPHFVLHAKPELSANGLEPCLIVTADERRQAGHMVHFDTEKSTLTFHPDRSSNINISFSNLKSLNLTNSVELKHLELPANIVNVEVRPAFATTKCVVHFKGGGSLISEVKGFVDQDAGLFLFTAQYGNHVLRSFISAMSIESYHIDDQLGKMLVNEKIVPLDQVKAGLEKQEHRIGIGH